MPFPGRTMEEVVETERKTLTEQVAAHLHHDRDLTRAAARTEAERQVAKLYE
tara:strand:+ start:602 stop:757 length:156 start_codon:yes stop_codon:yes gene_type:complete